jgi:cysteinyl-tRNA synthetase
MARRYLGDRFDLHTGGIDNVFPHHEDEIAQSEPLVGGPPATAWVHGEHLLMAGRKMAKSAGNFQRVTELAERGLDPLAFRYLTLTSRYGRKLNYSETSLDAAAAGLASLRARFAGLGPPPGDGPWVAPAVLAAGAAGDRPIGSASGVAGFGEAVGYEIADRAHEPTAPLSPAGRELHERFVAALDDDLDLPGALACVREMLRADLSQDERRWLVLDADAVLGLDLHLVWDSPSKGSTGPTDSTPPADITAMAIARDEARAARDYARADDLRRELGRRGWDVVDGPGGSTLRRR